MGKRNEDFVHDEDVAGDEFAFAGDSSGREDGKGDKGKGNIPIEGGEDESEENSGDEFQDGNEESPEAGSGDDIEEEDEAGKISGISSKQSEKELAEAREKYLRLYAEFDNFRKRTEKEKTQMFEMGAKDVIERLLPVVDNFERAMGTIQEEDREDSFVKGVEGIYKQIMKIFADLQVEPIEALGKKFDPNLHNAVMTDEESDAEEDTVTQDLQKGYTYRGTVVRHSMVKVKK